MEAVKIDLRETEAFFHRVIPLTRAMGVRVISYDGKALVLEAPLAPNHNHLGTAFGGSLTAMATLAGYGLLWLELGDPGAHVVIRESSAVFRRPVLKSIRAVGHRPPAEDLLRFREEFARNGKARLTIKVTIEEDDTAAMEFLGTFVAVHPPGT
jgi:thioesterase domain-containing protein